MSTSGHKKQAPKRPAPPSKTASGAAKRKRTESPFIIGPTGQRLWHDSESSSLENLPDDLQSVYFEHWNTIRT